MGDPLKRTLLILTFVIGILDAVSFLALTGGPAGALLARAAGPGSEGGLRLAMLVEIGLLVVAGALAALVDVNPGGASAYLIAMLSLAMGLRNTVARQIGDPNLATTVLNLTLSGFVTHTPIGLASEGELALRGAAFAAILVGAVTGALLLKVSLTVAIAAAVAGVAGAAISSRGTGRTLALALEEQ